MDRLIPVVVFISALGAGLIGGLFFAFSAFIMSAFGRIAPAAGMLAMQSINVTILNPLFFAVFFGTAICSVMLGIVAITNWSSAASGYLLAGSVLYLAGSILVTMVLNVPLNDLLAAAKPGSTEGTIVWNRYLSVWTAWNHVRTVASIAAAASFIMAWR